jgi:ABC-type amino acid transport substrate-binding protein
MKQKAAGTGTGREADDRQGNAWQSPRLHRLHQGRITMAAAPEAVEIMPGKIAEDLQRRTTYSDDRVTLAIEPGRESTLVRRQKTKMLAWVIGVSAVCLSLSQLQAAAEPVRFACQEHFPPFVEMQDGKPVGLLVDILTAAVAREKIDAVIVPVPFAQVQETLRDGRAEAIFPLAVTPERRKSFDFTAPLVMTGGALFVRAPNPTPAGLSALAGKTVVTPGTGPLAAYIRKVAPEIKLVITTDYPESLARLVEGKADAAALNYQVGASLANKLHPGQVTVPHKMFSAEPDAVAVAKGQHAYLLKRLNAGIAAMRADGTWQKIDDHWMGQ